MTVLPAEVRRKIAELRRGRRWGPSLWALGSTLVILGGCVALVGWRLEWWTAGLAWLGIGLMQYRLVLAAHEATHKTLMPPVWLSEAVGLFCASLVGVSLFNYRRAHLEHHKTPQSIEEDIDGYIYRPLLRARPGWPRFWLLWVGNYVDILTKLRRKFFGDGEVEGAHRFAGESRPGWREVAKQTAPLVVVQGLIWAGWTWALGWWAYPVFWVAPLFMVALQLDRVRTFLEHGYHYFFPGPPEPDLSRAPQTTIDVETNAVERYFFAPFGFSDHQAHHAQLTVPFYQLPELRKILAEHDPRYVRRIRASYFTLLAQLVHAPLPETRVAPESGTRVGDKAPA